MQKQRTYVPLLIGLLASTMTAQTAGAQRQRGTAGKAVALTTASCPIVADGDLVTFSWNPVFEHASSVTGVQSFELQFAREQDKAITSRTGAPLILLAAPRVHGEVPSARNKEIEPGTNGVYDLRFHLHLHELAAGEYRLVKATAMAKTDGTFSPDEATMTNSPMQLPYCLTIAGSAAGTNR
ncbi:MAG: hypothetical protein PW735_12370 [Acidobacteriaceae bacterium]|nr:hypothetical protein [Acidobacteriaceae bacterium]